MIELGCRFPEIGTCVDMQDTPDAWTEDAVDWARPEDAVDWARHAQPGGWAEHEDESEWNLTQTQVRVVVVRRGVILQEISEPASLRLWDKFIEEAPECLGTHSKGVTKEHVEELDALLLTSLHVMLHNTLDEYQDVQEHLDNAIEWLDAQMKRNNAMDEEVTLP